MEKQRHLGAVLREVENSPQETVVQGLPNLAAQWNPLGLFKKYDAWAPRANILI